MKILRVDSAQFRTLFAKMVPQERFMHDIKTPNLYLACFDTLVVLRESIKIVELPDLNGGEITMRAVGQSQEVSNG